MQSQRMVGIGGLYIGSIEKGVTSRSPASMAPLAEINGYSLIKKASHCTLNATKWGAPFRFFR